MTTYPPEINSNKSIDEYFRSEPIEGAFGRGVFIIFLGIFFRETVESKGSKIG